MVLVALLGDALPEMDTYTQQQVGEDSTLFTRLLKAAICQKDQELPSPLPGLVPGLMKGTDSVSNV